MIHYGLYGGLPHSADQYSLSTLEGYQRGVRKSPVLGAPDLWGVGQAEFPSGTMPMPVTWTEIDIDITWYQRLATSMGIEADQFILYTLNHAQSAQMWPWLHLTFQRKARFATVMPVFWDASRLEMYLRRFHVSYVFGIAPAMLDGLATAGHDPIAVLGRADRMSAQPGAWERLTAAGLKPWRITWIGPILLIDPCDGSGGRYDSSQWNLECVDGEIVLTSAPTRAARFERVATGIRGVIETIDGEPRAFTV